MRFFTAFHANLDFSAIPDTDRSQVIARCYWPLLELPERLGIPIGFEASARTLQTLQDEDPEWLKRFRGLAERGLVEPIGSGLAQLVGPLVPSKVNRANLRLGNVVYRDILGWVPDTFFVNEQTFSDGLIPLYAEAGAKRLVMEWNNPASRMPSLRALRCRPARLRAEGGLGPELLWNDSIVFQKMQRVAHGQVPRSDLDTLLERVSLAEESGALCIYGGDVEIFDYRPSRIAPERELGDREIDRLIDTLRAYSEDPRFEFVLPRDVIEEGEALPEVTLGCAADPIPCKKQPRYNPTRWAVSGRDGFGMNTRCHHLFRVSEAARRLAGEGEPDSFERELVESWRSDFRTRATEEKLVEFETRVGGAIERGRSLLERVTPSLREGEDLLLVNPGSCSWDAIPVEVPLRLPPGRYFDLAVRARRGGEISSDRVQVEIQGRHRDGSIREAALLLEPTLGAREELGLAFCGAKSPSRAEPCEGDPTHPETTRVRARMIEHRGGALEEVIFPGIAEGALFGTIPHGHFAEIAYTPDFYSGHVVAVGENGEKATDLSATRVELCASATGPVRATVVATVASSHGPWRKIVRLYRNAPRIDVVHDLSFHEARLASLRLGTVTLKPDSWNRSSLRYGTVNGGLEPEWRSLPRNVVIDQSKAVSPSVSAHSCLGGTEGWVAFEDDERGLLIQGDRSEAAVVPLLDFEDLADGFFCRLTHSAAESDETRATFVRGRRRFAFSIDGYRTGSGADISRARNRSQGLVYRTEAGVGLTNDL